MLVTFQIAMAAGRDAANRNMRAEGRSSWNDADWDIATSVVKRMMGAA